MVLLNLAREPFRNLRPLRRTGFLLLAAGLLLAVVDGRVYWRHFSGENQNRVRLQALDAQIAAEREELAGLRRQLARFDSEVLNERAAFVNAQIRQRTFSWSGLFDHLVEILPNDAHLVSLNPQFGDSRRLRRESPLREGEVLLEIDGVARNSAKVLELIDAAFAHPSFRAPDLKREATRDNRLEFTLSMIYKPGAAAGEADGAAEAEEPEAGDSEPTAPPPPAEDEGESSGPEGEA